jgi:hypothetical protein
MDIDEIQHPAGYMRGFLCSICIEPACLPPPPLKARRERHAYPQRAIRQSFFMRDGPQGCMARAGITTEKVTL